MRFKYAGPGDTSTQGHAFKEGEWVEVGSPNAIARLCSNPFFEQETADKTEEIQVKPEPKKRGRKRKQFNIR